MFESRGARMRATMPAGPPAATGTMKRTTRLGHSGDCICAHAAQPVRLGASADPANSANRRRRVSTVTPWLHLSYPIFVCHFPVLDRPDGKSETHSDEDR